MSTPERPVGVAWAPEPVHWSELKAGDVIEIGDRLVVIVAIGVHKGQRWVQVFNGREPDNHWATPADPDPLALVLVRRDALVGQVLPPDPPG